MANKKTVLPSITTDVTVSIPRAGEFVVCLKLEVDDIPGWVNGVDKDTLEAAVRYAIEQKLRTKVANPGRLVKKINEHPKVIEERARRKAVAEKWDKVTD